MVNMRMFCCPSARVEVGAVEEARPFVGEADAALVAVGERLRIDLRARVVGQPAHQQVGRIGRGVGVGAVLLVGPGVADEDDVVRAAAAAAGRAGVGRLGRVEEGARILEVDRLAVAHRSVVGGVGERRASARSGRPGVAAEVLERLVQRGAVLGRRRSLEVGRGDLGVDGLQVGQHLGAARRIHRRHPLPQVAGHDAVAVGGAVGVEQHRPGVELERRAAAADEGVQHQPERAQLDLPLQQRAVAAEHLLDVAEAARQRDRAARVGGVALGQRAALAPGLRRGRPVGAVVEEEQDVRRGHRSAGAGVKVDVLGLRRLGSEHAEADDRRSDRASDAQVEGACLVLLHRCRPGESNQLQLLARLAMSVRTSTPWTTLAVASSSFSSAARACTS